MPAMYVANVQAAAANAAKLPAVSVTFSLSDSNGNPITPLIGGTINASTIAISGIANIVNKVPVQTSLEFSGANLTAGALVGNPSSPLLKPTDVVTKGSITLSSTGAVLLFDSGNSITNNGAALNIVNKGGLIDVGHDDSFTDNGGNISILAKGNVGGGPRNAFTAVGVQGTATGGIEVGAGTTTSALAKGFATPAMTTPTLPTGATITPNLNNKQVVLLLPAGTSSVTLTNYNLNFTNQGVMVFQAVGGANVQLDTTGSTGTFTTSSSKPIGFSTMDENEDVVVDSGDVPSI